MSCPVCEASSPRLVATSVRAHLLRCAACGHAFAQAIGATDIYGADYSGLRTDESFERALASLCDTTLRTYLPADARVLDIGCGNGAFLRVAQALGCAVRGIDTSAAAVEACRARGSEAEIGDVSGVTPPAGGFDVVTLWDVLEHIEQPVAFLRQAHALLRPGGRLVIKSPSVSWRALFLTRLWPRLADVVLQAPHHMQFFSRETLDLALKRAGFAERVFLPCGRLRRPRSTRSWRKLAGRLLTRASLDWRSPTLLVVASRP